MKKTNDLEFASIVADASTRLFSAEDARNASSARLVDVACGDYAGFAKNNAIREMRSRIACEKAGKTGYAGCAEMFADYVG
ncbi:hypothetical protein [uncultured Slackia sp.]|uniref:hypothetical protein n=1 Tax=uncultured Slackia sp. TaxID=665903 RepID=UPI002803FAAB|nr:hypothetical protein [uncultured Slackia sp.]